MSSLSLQPAKEWAFKHSAFLSYAIMALGITASVLITDARWTAPVPPPEEVPVQLKQEPEIQLAQVKAQKAERLATKVVKAYKVKSHTAKEVVRHVVAKTSPDVFPSPDLVLAIIKVESNFDPNAKSHAGAKGLMQVMNGTYHPSQNIDDGISRLREYKDRYKSLHMALEAYNVGPGNLRKGVRNPGYVVKVLAALADLRRA